MACDLCGKNKSTSKAKVEGVLYDVCADCAQYGKPVKEVERRQRKQKGPDNRTVRSDAGSLIRSAREKKGKKQAEFAKMLRVKESELHAWETGHRTPTVKMAERIQRMLHISLLEDDAPVNTSYDVASDSAGLTIGDLLKKKD